MSIQICIAVNQTGSPVELREFGSIIVPGAGQYVLSDDTNFYEIKSGEELSGYIADGTLLINDGTSTLTSGESLNYVSPWYTPYDAPAAISTVATTSGTWNDVASTVQTNSAQWDESSDLDALSAAITGNAADIQAVSSQVDTNITNISANATNIATNAGDIIDLQTDVGSLSGAIDNNTGMISANAGDIVVNTGMISANAADIATNEGMISANAADIVDVENQLSGYVDLTTDQDIYGNKRFHNNLRVDGVFTATSSVIIETEEIAISANFIDLNNNVTGTPTEDAGIRVIRGSETAAELRWNETEDRWEHGISGNLSPIPDATDLSTLSSAIDTNADNISTNTGMISANAGDIVTNTNMISANAGDISTLASASGGWDDTETTVGTNSANWDSTYSTVLANSADWESAQIPVLSAPPAGPDVGDQWIRSTDMLLFSYSDTYSGWVGDQMMTFAGTRNRVNTTDVYLRTSDGVPTNISPQLMVHDSVIVGMSTASDDVETWTLEVRKNGNTSPIDSLTQTAAQQAYAIDKTTHVDAGDKLHLYCNGTAIDHPMGEIIYRWRVDSA